MTSGFFRKLIFFFFTIVSGNFILAQKTYFQQEVNYSIKVSLNDENHTLTGFETIEYSNNSPDTLEFIYFHLWPNAYKNTKTAYAKQELENGDNKFYYSSPDEKGYIDSLNFKVDDKKIDWELTAENIDICKLYLNDPLLPGGKIIITTPFIVKIPGSFSRFGHVGQSYQVTQWYPKPAVYDRDGWHPMPYLNQGEFYSEFGSFDVEITLPEKYVVGATGELQTESEINRLNQKAGSVEYNDTEYESENRNYKTIRYTEKNIHDFAWFADKNYLVSKDSVQLPNSGKWVTSWAMYPQKDAAKWAKATEYINDAVYLYSKWYGDYPYKNCSAVRGSIEAGGAMEYPEITVVGSAGTDLTLETMIMHEVGHNWFYGILGFNEREYPYLDEGFNSFSEFRYVNEKYQKTRKAYEMGVKDKVARFFNIDDLPFGMYYEISSLMPQRNNIDQPMISNSYDITFLNYSSVTYHKSALAYYYLLNVLGEEKFNTIMQEFYQTWKFKHPRPEDFRAAFESYSEKNLSWFFDELIATSKKVDYKAVRVKDNKLLVKNKGQITSPVFIAGYKANQQQFLVYDSGFFAKKWIDLPAVPYDKITINDMELPEYNRKNNTLKTTGLFKKCGQLEISKFQILEKPDKTQLGMLPAAGWNVHDNLMLGLLLYNPVLPRQKFEYQLVPMFGIKRKEFTGTGKLALHTFPELGFSNKLDFTLSGLQYSGINKVKLEMTFILKKLYSRSPLTQKISVSGTSMGVADNSLGDRRNFYNLKYSLKNKYILHPFNLLVNFELADNSPRMVSVFNLTLPAKYAKNAVSVRLFSGFIFDKETELPLYLSGGSFADYQADLVLPGRFEPYAGDKVFSYQYAQNHGGFTSYSIFNSKKWMTTAQVKIKIPKLPLKIYGSVGTYSEAGEEFPGDPETFTSNTLAYETGIEFAMDDFISLYMPVFVSSDIDNYLGSVAENYGQRIRFSLNLPLMNLFELRDSKLD